MKKCLKVLSYILMFILGIIALLNIVFYIKRLISKEQCPTLFGYGYAIITSHSMSPTIETYDLIIIKKQKEYNVGDIVTHTLNNTVITHRIVKIEQDNNKTTITTKGDYYENSIDTPFDSSAINGKVVAVIPKLGFIQLFLNQPYGILCLALILTTIFILPDFLTKKEKNDK